MNNRADQVRRKWQAALSWISRQWKHQPATTVILALIVVIGASLRVAFLNRLVRMDEATIYHRYVTKPVAEIISTYDQPGNHVLQSVLTRFAYLAFGNHPWSLRLPSIVAGVLIIPATYVWAKQEYGRPAGLTAAGLTAASSFLIDYSTRARGYIMVALFFVLALNLARRLIDRWDTRTALLLAVINALALYTIPVAVYSVGMVLVWLVICIAADRREKDWAQIGRGGGLMLGAMSLLTAILYAPILINAGLPALIANRYVLPPSEADYTQIAPRVLTLTLEAWTSDMPALLVWVMLASFIASLLAHRRIAIGPIPAALAALVIPVLIAAQRVVPPPRTSLFLVPVYLSGVAGAFIAGLRWMSARLRLKFTDGWIQGLAIVTALGLGGIVYAHESAADWDIIPLERNALPASLYLASQVEPAVGVTGDPRAAELVSYYLDTFGKPVVLITGDPTYPYPRSSVPSRLFVTVLTAQRGTLQMARFRLGQIQGFDPTVYTVPELIKVINDLHIYVVSAK